VSSDWKGAIRASGELAGANRNPADLQYARMSVIVFPQDGQGFCAELKVGNDYHILLMAIHTGVGPMAAIYDVRANKWWRERQWAEDIEDAKKKAADIVRVYYRGLHLRDPFPTLVWTEKVNPVTLPLPNLPSDR
jgi:hypothetical protein